MGMALNSNQSREQDSGKDVLKFAKTPAGIWEHNTYLQQLLPVLEIARRKDNLAVTCRESGR
jgi:hypothetical protein